MKRLLILLLLFAMPLMAQYPILFLSKDMSGTVLDGQTLTATPVLPFVTDGTNIFVGYPISGPFVTGTNILDLYPGQYNVQITDFPHSWLITVPTNYVGPLPINAITLSSGVPSYFTNIVAVVSWQYLVAGTNIVFTTNGLYLTISTTGTVGPSGGITTDSGQPIYTDSNQPIYPD